MAGLLDKYGNKIKRELKRPSVPLTDEELGIGEYEIKDTSMFSAFLFALCFGVISILVVYFIWFGK